MERAGVRHLVVGRLRKPHGLKGECTVYPLTDRPETVFAAGRRLVRMALSGELVGEAIEVERSRAYHREWLLKFRGLESREELEGWRGQFLAAASADLPPPAEGEVYLHELAGFAVRDPAGTALGVVTEVYELPAGLTLEVQGPRREFLLPFRREFVREVDRAGRRLVVELPEGLVEP